MAGVASQPGPAQSGRPQSSSHIIALLSLNIILLAFFILLNALANFEQTRSDAAVASVREAFKGIVRADRNLSTDTSGLTALDGTKEVVDSLKQLFSDRLPLEVRQESSGDWTLQVDIPVVDLFVEQGVDLRPDGAETLRLVAGVLADPSRAKAEYQVDVFYGLDGRDSGLADNRPALDRAGALVRDLQRQGLNPARLSAGLMPDFPGKVRLHFTIVTDPAPAAPAAGNSAGGQG